jgi:hypothetical protein
LRSRSYGYRRRHWRLDRWFNDFDAFLNGFRRCCLRCFRLGLDRDRLRNRHFNRRFFHDGRVARDDCRGSDGLDQPRRSQHGRGRFGGFRLLGNGAGLLASGDGRFGKHVAAGERNAPLTGQSLDELPGNNLFDCARSALQLDSMIALQQRHHFLARGVEQLRYLVNPDCGHSVLSSHR